MLGCVFDGECTQARIRQFLSGGGGGGRKINILRPFQGAEGKSL